MPKVGDITTHPYGGELVRGTVLQVHDDGTVDINFQWQGQNVTIRRLRMQSDAEKAYDEAMKVLK
jgi:hypothetical protein